MKVGDLIQAHDRLGRGAYFPMYASFADVLRWKESGGLWTGETGIVLDKRGEGSESVLKILASSGSVGWIYQSNVQVAE